MYREEGKAGGELALDYHATGETVYEKGHSNQNYGLVKAQNWKGSKGHLLESPAHTAVERTDPVRLQWGLLCEQGFLVDGP